MTETPNEANEFETVSGDDAAFDDEILANSTEEAGSPENIAAEWEAKLAEAQDRTLRIAADFDNARKRWEREKVESRVYAIQDFAKDLLPVIDSFDNAMTSINQIELDLETDFGKKIGSILEGVKLVQKAFADSLKKHGVEKLPAKGSAFNPMHHNAIAKVVDTTVEQEIVVDEFVAGYKIGDRILRTAMVRVASPD